MNLTMPRAFTTPPRCLAGTERNRLATPALVRGRAALWLGLLPRWPGPATVRRDNGQTLKDQWRGH